MLVIGIGFAVVVVCVSLLLWQEKKAPVINDDGQMRYKPETPQERVRKLREHTLADVDYLHAAINSRISEAGRVLGYETLNTEQRDAIDDFITVQGNDEEAEKLLYERLIRAKQVEYMNLEKERRCES